MPITGDDEEERRAACRGAGRAVAAGLLGLTLRWVALVWMADPSGSGLMKLRAGMELKQKGATPEEQAFIDLGGLWAELDGVDFRTEPKRAVARILEQFKQLYPNLDRERTRYGLTYLISNYAESVRALAKELIEKRKLSGIDCGKVIVSSRRIQQGPC